MRSIGRGGSRSETKGTAAGVCCKCYAGEAGDAPDVAMYVCVGVEPELRHGDEATVHGFGCAGADTVAVRYVHDELEVGAIA